MCSEVNKTGYVRHQFGDSEFEVPEQYINLVPRGAGAQGTVW